MSWLKEATVQLHPDGPSRDSWEGGLSATLGRVSKVLPQQSLSYLPAPPQVWLSWLPDPGSYLTSHSQMPLMEGWGRSNGEDFHSA